MPARSARVCRESTRPVSHLLPRRCRFETEPQVTVRKSTRVQHEERDRVGLRSGSALAPGSAALDRTGTGMARVSVNRGSADGKDELSEDLPRRHLLIGLLGLR